MKKGGTDMRFYELTKRNVKRFFLEKSTVFFSLLSMLIVLGLMLVLLGDMHVDTITSILAAFPGRDAAADKENAVLMVLQWITAGIVGINAVTVTLSVYAAMISDRVSGKMDSIYTAPVSRYTISSSYVVSAWICSVLICTLTLVIAEAYCVFKGCEPYTVKQHFELMGMICINSFAYSAIMYFFAVLVKSVGAWSSIGTIIGTLVGFIGGIYIPIGSFSKTVASAIKLFPVIYGTKLFRTVTTVDAEKVLFEGIPEDVVNDYRLSVGTDLTFSGNDVSNTACILILIGCGILFTVLSAVVMKHSNKAEK